ncbi:uncharacterized protein LOC108601121 [Drosophila busckii]|uniref:uncharacterized protein LOC108601121 n=1 Tax=Drosophila busckii TaxID=30019 RepID=UPI00083EE271|nr:uncharacterized protein LOC108601121 [Drosophila busckii]
MVYKLFFLLMLPFCWISCVQSFYNCHSAPMVPIPDDAPSLSGMWYYVGRGSYEDNITCFNVSVSLASTQDQLDFGLSGFYKGDKDKTYKSLLIGTKLLMRRY